MTGEPAPPFALPRTEVRTMRSAADGQEYRILVALPSEPAPASGFPVIYLLDANATFGTVVEAIRMRSHRPAATGVVPAIVVGIAYPIDGPYDRARRTYDFTPAGAETALAAGDDAQGPTGGALPFLDFLDDVKHRVEADFSIDPHRQVLVGHSLGGRLALHALLERPRRFQSYVAISPSLWWQWSRLLEQADVLTTRLASETIEAGVFICVGEYEQALAPWQSGAPNAAEVARRRDERQMVSRARAFADRLGRAAASGLRVEFEEFAGEDHASVVPIAISRALRFALFPPPARQPENRDNIQ